jgi:tetratricopeptide (TPR) repeat protein
MNPIGFYSSGSTRAPQTPDPPNSATARLLNALRIGRVAGVAKWLDELSINSPYEQAWKDYLRARILLEQCDFAGAKALAQRAASGALRMGLVDPPDATPLRLSAAALELEGTALRRQDQAMEAHRIHSAAFALRREHGTDAEQSESAICLGSCAQWLGDIASAERWYRFASNLEAADANQARQQSCALIRLSALLTKLSRHEEAVEAARRAHRVLSDHSPGDILTICASLHLAQCMIGHAEALLVEKADLAKSLLEEASQMLRCTRENLQAFGFTFNEELNWCDQQLDFADRLRQSL